MKAIVNSPVCPLMSQPRRDCEMADEALFGMVVDVLERTTPGYCRVRTHYRYEGYACVDDLILSDGRAAWWAGLPKKVVFHKNTCDVMADPKVQSWQLVTLPRGAVVSPVGEAEGGWQRTALPDGREGYLRASILTRPPRRRRRSCAGALWKPPCSMPEPTTAGAASPLLASTARA